MKLIFKRVHHDGERLNMKRIIHKIGTLLAATVMIGTFIITGLIESLVWIEEQWKKLK
ncbi:MAG: hypothetical protein GY760_14140 [Deltaproteobacteria bacterium]|nr:hypothetical protein [Deltaproteobacteria bacterium]